MQYLTIIKDIFSIIGIGTSIFIASLGLNTWRRQLKGNSKYELSKNILKSIYLIREMIIEFRFPFYFYYELNNSLSQKDFEDTANSYSLRWSKVSDKLPEFFRLKMEAKILLSLKETILLIELENIIRELHITMNKYLSTLKISGEIDIDKMEKFDSILHTQTGNPDEYLMQLNTAIEKIEEQLQRYIK